MICPMGGWVEWQVSGARKGGNGASSLVRAPLVPAGRGASALVPYLLSPTEAGMAPFSTVGLLRPLDWL